MEPRALLIFADSAHTDCQQRGWPVAFRVLLETQRFRFGEKRGVDVHFFTSQGFRRMVPPSCQVHYQEGASFGQRLEHAIECLVGIGYREIVIVGSDCPDLAQSDIVHAFELLRQHRLVLGPDHRGGCYLIGLRANDAARLNGVLWQRNTDYRQIRQRFAVDPVAELPVKIDLDTFDDIWLLAGSKSPFRWLAKALLDSKGDYIALEINNAPHELQEQRILWQLPPPASL